MLSASHLQSYNFYEFYLHCFVSSDLKLILVCTHTHTFNGPLSGTTQVSRYQKGKTNLDFSDARDSGWQWHQLGHMQVGTSLQIITRPAPHHSVFYRPDALPAAQPTASKHWRHFNYINLDQSYMDIYVIDTNKVNGINISFITLKFIWLVVYRQRCCESPVIVQSMHITNLPFIFLTARLSKCQLPARFLMAGPFHHSFWLPC